MRSFALLALVIGLVSGCGGTAPATGPVGSTASPVGSAASPVGSAASPASPANGLPEGVFDLWARGVPIQVTIPGPGWFGEPNDGVVVKDDSPDAPDGAGLIVFAGDPGGLYVYGDPCAWSTTRPATPAGTVEELLMALAAQASRDATTPRDVMIAGHPGKSITLHVPEDADFSACDQGHFASWGVVAEDPARWHQDPGQIDELWVLDVNGVLVVLDAAYYAGTPAPVIDELRAIVESTTFGG